MPDRRVADRPWTRTSTCYACTERPPGLRRRYLCDPCAEEVRRIRALTPKERSIKRDEMDLAEARWRIAVDPPELFALEPVAVEDPTYSDPCRRPL